MVAINTFTHLRMEGLPVLQPRVPGARPPTGSALPEQAVVDRQVCVLNFSFPLWRGCFKEGRTAVCQVGHSRHPAPRPGPQWPSEGKAEQAAKPRKCRGLDVGPLKSCSRRQRAFGTRYRWCFDTAPRHAHSNSGLGEKVRVQNEIITPC